MKKTFAVGIAGGSASGKSTFSDALEKALKNSKNLDVYVFHMDSYFKAEKDRPQPRVEAPFSSVMYADDNHPTSIDLPKLSADLEKAVASDKYDVIIVEGLFTLCEKDIYSQLDLKLFVECRPDERIVRRLKRNMAWGLSFDEIANVYIDMVRFRHDEYVEPSKWRADIILNGSYPSEITLKMIVDYIENKYK